LSIHETTRCGLPREIVTQFYGQEKAREGRKLLRDSLSKERNA